MTAHQDDQNSVLRDIRENTENNGFRFRKTPSHVFFPWFANFNAKTAVYEIHVHMIHVVYDNILYKPR